MAGRKKIVVIGNSIVRGFPLFQEKSFPNVIRMRTGFEVVNKGENGETTQGILSRFNRDLVFQKPDIGIILTGTNDFLFKKAEPQECMQNLEKAVAMGRASGIRMILLTPLLTYVPMATELWMRESDVDYDKVNEKLKDLATLLLDYAEKKFIEVVDIQKSFESYAWQIGYEKAYIDGVHPTEEGHELIAERISQIL